MIKKTMYITPESELLIFGFEENFLQSGPGSGYNKSGNAGNDMTEDDDYRYSF